MTLLRGMMNLKAKKNITFFTGNKILNFFSINIIFKKAVFSEKITATVLTAHLTIFFRKSRRLVPKINITFFIPNYMLNMFSFNNFIQKSSIFRENLEKLFSGHI